MKQVEEAFRQAQQHHQAGRGEAAAALYRKILAKVPGHPGAHHGSGLLLLERVGLLRQRVGLLLQHGLLLLQARGLRLQ